MELGLVGETVVRNSEGSAAWGETAFERVFREYYGRIVGALHRMVGDRGQAEELASEAFLRLYARPEAEEDYENVGGWLYRTATRLGIDFLRSAGRRERREQEAAPDLSAPIDGPLEECLRAERQRQVRATLARLKPVQAQILMLRSSGLSYKELATTLQVKPASVGQLLARSEAAFERAWKKTVARG
jgi:RNA polymerase sigma factor (sigma-70 family)